MNTTTNNHFTIQRLLEITSKEVLYFEQTRNRLLNSNINIKWIETLEQNEQNSEMLDAFVSRFSRLQDTLGDKLLPAILKLNLETVGSQLDNVFRAEKLGWIDSADKWIELRGLRNKLIHEYMTSASDFFAALIQVLEQGEMLIRTQQLLANNAKKNKP